MRSGRQTRSLAPRQDEAPGFWQEVERGGRGSGVVLFRFTLSCWSWAGGVLGWMLAVRGYRYTRLGWYRGWGGLALSRTAPAIVCTITT